MAAKTPPIYSGHDQPNSGWGPAAVNGNAAFHKYVLGTPVKNSDHDHLINHQSTNLNSHSAAALDPPASSSLPSSPPSQHLHHQYQHQPSYAPSSSSFSFDHGQHDHLYAPAPTRPTGKFTEEWDASQRGSSIINGPIPRGVFSSNNNYSNYNNNMSSIQRSNSTSGSVTGGPSGAGAGGSATMDGSSSIQVSRSNTLKKKSSMRRSGSLRRAGSRRSMKAGSVRSLALQSNADEDEVHNAFYCPVPTSGNPTEALANRFQGEFGELFVHTHRHTPDRANTWFALQPGARYSRT